MAAFCQFVILILVSFVYGEDESKIVKTHLGKFEGALAANGLYYEFLGIRYGIPVKFRVNTYLYILRIGPFYVGS